MHRNDILALASLIVGLASAFTVGTPGAAMLDTITAGHGALALAILGALGIIGNQVIRMLNAPAQGGTK